MTFYFSFLSRSLTYFSHEETTTNEAHKSLQFALVEEM